MIARTCWTIICFTLGTCLFAQLPTDKPYYAKYKKDFKESYWSIGGALVSAGGLWGSAPSLDKPLLDPFTGKDGMGASGGFLVRIGRRGVFVSAEDVGYIETANRFYIGWLWDIEYVNHGTPDWSAIFPNATYTGVSEIGLRMGASANWNINNSLVLEGYGGISFALNTHNPTITNELSDGLTEETSFYIYEGDDIETELGIIAPFFGFNLRLRYFSLFIESYNRKYQNPYVLEHYFDGADNRSIVDFSTVFDITTLRYGLSLTL